MSSLNIDTWSATPGSNTASAPNGAPEGMAPSGVNDCIRQVMAVHVVNGRSLPTAGGSANAQTLTNSIPMTTLVRGMRQRFYPVAANTGDTTFAPDGLTAKHIYAYGAVLLGGELQTNVPADLVYDETLNSSAGGWVLMNPNDATGSFTLTLATGLTTTPSGTVNWRIVKNKTVNVWVAAAITGTSNANSMTATGVPSALQIVTGSRVVWCGLTDNGGTIAGAVSMASASGTWTFRSGINTSGFTTSGTKGISALTAFSYDLD